MTKKIKMALVLFIIGIAAISAWFVLGNQLQTTKEGFAIYLLDSNELVLSDKDIISYNKTSHEIKLNQDAMARMRALDLYGKPFVIKLGNREIYDGSFSSEVSSIPSSGVIILDVLAVQYGLADGLRIQAGYPSSEFFKGADPRNNCEILNHFREFGKLIQ